MKTIIAILIATILWQPATVIETNDDVVSIEINKNGNGYIYEFYGDGFAEGDEIEVLKILDVIVDVR